jgi:hypothetical protein
MPNRLITDPTFEMTNEFNRGPNTDLIPLQTEPEQLPILNAEDFPEQYRQPTRSNIGDLFSVYDYAVNAPIRAGVSAYQKSAERGDILPEMRGFWGAAKQYFKKPEDSPSWSGIAEDAGFSPLTFRDAAMQAGLQGYYPDISPADIGGYVGENVFDPTNLIGGGAVMGGLKYGDDALRGAKNLGDDLASQASKFDNVDDFINANEKINGMNISDFVRKEKLPEQLPIPEKGYLSYVKTDDGSIYFDTKAGPHALIIDKQKIPKERVTGGGFISDGVVTGSESPNAAPIGQQYRAIKRVEFRRKFNEQVRPQLTDIWNKSRGQSKGTGKQ